MTLCKRISDSLPCASPPPRPQSPRTSSYCTARRILSSTSKTTSCLKLKRYFLIGFMLTDRITLLALEQSCFRVVCCLQEIQKVYFERTSLSSQIRENEGCKKYLLLYSSSSCPWRTRPRRLRRRQRTRLPRPGGSCG